MKSKSQETERKIPFFFGSRAVTPDLLDIPAPAPLHEKEVEFTAAELTKLHESKKALGGSGIYRDEDGIPEHEPNPELSPYRARGLQEDLGIYHEMYRGDGAISGTWNLIAREIQRSRKDLWMPPDPSDLEREIYDFVAKFFGLDGTMGWLRGGLDDLLHDASRCLIYGFQPFEITAEEVQWRGETKLAPCKVTYIAPHSVLRWLYDKKTDDLTAMTQVLASQSDGKYSFVAAERRVNIPIEKLLLFQHNAVTGNPEGESLFRSAYTFWKAKKDIMIRHHMAIERLSNGLMVLEEVPDPETGLPMETLSPEDLDNFMALFDMMVKGEVGWISQPVGWRIRAEFPQFKIPSPVEYLKYLDHQMHLTSLSGLIGFEGGQFFNSLVDGHGAILYNSIQAIAEELLAVINGVPGRPWTGLIAKMVNHNFDVDETVRFPRVRVNLTARTDKAYVDMITKASQFKLVHLGPRDEAAFRDQVGLPEESIQELQRRHEEDDLSALGLIGGGTDEADPDSGAEEPPAEESGRQSEEGGQAPQTGPKDGTGTPKSPDSQDVPNAS